MINTNMLKDQVYDKMKDLTFHTVVNKVLLGALPVDKSEMTRENTLAVSTYSLRALESAGGFGLLEKALEETTDPIKHYFLEEIYNVCTESAMEVANRVAMEAETDDDDTDSSDSDDDSGAMPHLEDDSVDDSDNDDDDDDTSIDDVKAPDDSKPVPVKPEVIRQGKPFKDLVADAKMTDEEYGRFVDKMGKLDLPEVSRLINDRVETAMKAEKETYKMIDETDQKLRDVITDKAEDEGETLTDDQADEIKESMLAVPLKNMQREHVSLFSKIQAAAIESIQMESKLDPDVINSDILLGITENYTVDGIFKHTEPTLEQILDKMIDRTTSKAAIEGCCDSPETTMVLGTAFAAIVYTLLQTLHSMNLVHITPPMVKHCCERRSPYEDRIPQNDVDVYHTKLRAALERDNRLINKSRYAPDVESAIEHLNHIRSKVYTARDHGLPVEESTIKAIEYSINNALNKRDSLISACEAAIEVPNSTFKSNKCFETDKCNMNNISRTFRNTQIDAIEFKCTEGATVINVMGNKNGRNIKNTTLALENVVDVPTAKYLKMLVTTSNLPNLHYGEVYPSITINVDGKRTNL